jgi:hypothetical protein
MDELGIGLIVYLSVSGLAINALLIHIGFNTVRGMWAELRDLRRTGYRDGILEKLGRR